MTGSWKGIVSAERAVEMEERAGRSHEAFILSFFS